MHTGARRSADPAVVKAAVPAKPAARAASPSERIGNAAPVLGDFPAPRRAGDALEGILARAVEQRAGDTDVALHVEGATLQRVVTLKAKDLDTHISTGAWQTVKGGLGATSKSKLAFVAIRDALSVYHGGKLGLKGRVTQLGVLAGLCEGFMKEHPSTDKRWTLVEQLSNEIEAERDSEAMLQFQSRHVVWEEQQARKKLEALRHKPRTKHDDSVEYETATAEAHDAAKRVAIEEGRAATLRALRSRP